MAMSVILSALGGEIEGIETVGKSYPRFFDDLQSVNIKFEVDS